MKALVRSRRLLQTTAQPAFRWRPCGQVLAGPHLEIRQALTKADIDYMDEFKVFTLGQNFPLAEVRDLVNNLHSKHQHYIVMVDPGPWLLSMSWSRSHML